MKERPYLIGAGAPGIRRTLALDRNSVRRIVRLALPAALAVLLAACQHPSAGSVSYRRAEAEDYPFQFGYRGGIVTYRPAFGAKWSPQGDDGAGIFASGPEPSLLPNGCLVYACSRAEQIRTDPGEGESRSRVVCYRREDGSGHAFVLYQKDGKSCAEDISGSCTVMPPFGNLSSAEALFMASTFQKRTHPRNFSPPIQASFIGNY